MRNKDRLIVEGDLNAQVISYLRDDLESGRDYDDLEKVASAMMILGLSEAAYKIRSAISRCRHTDQEMLAKLDLLK